MGFTQLQALVRESTLVQLAPGATDFLQDLGYEEPTVSSAYQRLVRLQSQVKHEEFQERMVSKLRSQQPREERSRQQSERRIRIFELVRQLRERQYLTKVRERAGVLHEAPAAVVRCLQEF